MLGKNALLRLSLAFSVLLQVKSESPIVNLPNGQIRGTQDTLSNPHNSPYLQDRDLTYNKYLGIPYAEPPVGNLRFRPPKPLDKKWSGVRDATTHGTACMQHKTKIIPPPDKMSEDCLYLDIWSPGNNTNSEPKAVMVWIHGGGYTLIYTGLYDGAMHAVIGDVVIVMMNYRLDVFGFLSTGDGAVPGNMGLLDQQLAIRWVKDNIALFGGDPKKITLFGESSGATSVTQQAIAPSNRGLFQRVISQSGTIFTEYAFHHKDMLQAVLKTARSLNCTDVSVRKLIECLQGVDAEELLNASRPALDGIDVIWGWNPVVDGKFIIKQPRDMLRSKIRGPIREMFKNIDLMVGHNSDEGYMFLQFYGLFQHPKFDAWNPAWNNVSFLRPILDKIMRSIGAKYGEPKAEIIYETLAYMYLDFHKGAEFDGEQLARIATELITDEWFLVPALQFAKLHAGFGGRTFKYHFAYRPSSSLHPDWIKGADHDAEFPFQFGTFPVDPVDQLVAYTLISYWSNFAKTGNPNEQAASYAMLPEWPRFTKEKSQYLEISTKSSQPGDIIKPNRVHFWTKYLPKIVASAKSRKTSRQQRKANED
ncbi:unnamed protein product [Owenia fusiformis]|uniref:Carboxylic ester hydrolase n=1 Tax=Owenia fusiformis TaxID=6347 RepID=A0A8J1UC12_OWEFU|nr:unnamed protein product [Owenia fusiformis]